jgi:hypothetical protein
MGLLPEQYAARIAFFQNRIANWTTEATNIGTTAGAVTALGTAVTAAATALADQQSAQSAAKTATLNLNLALATMDNLGMGIVEQVRTKARTGGDAVYVLADIPAPATPAPKPAPGQPTDFVATLSQDGSLDMGWKCPNPPGTSGTTYNVFRRDTPTAEFAYVGTSGQRKFVDTTIPAGSSQLTYKVQAIRSTSAGPWATFNVTFGVGGSGAITASVTETTPKLAA